MEPIETVIEIARPKEAVYAYVTQPWRWHEWHPNSQSAHASVEVLGVGDRFDETIMLQPLAPLPLRLRRATRYEVLEAEPGVRFRVRGEMRDGWVEIAYQLTDAGAGTRFHRALRYDAHGLTAALLPILARQMRRNSGLALANLKAKLEAGV